MFRKKGYLRIFVLVFLILLGFQFSTKADDIRDFDIEGFTIFTNLLDYEKKLNLTKLEIKNKKFKFYPKSKRIGLLRFNNINERFETYDGVQFAVDSKTYKIYTIMGIISENINTEDQCTKKQTEIIDYLHNMAPSAEKIVEGFSPHPADLSGKSIASGTYLDFKTGHSLSAECYIWSQDLITKGYDNNLKINIESKEGRLFVQNEAY